MPRLLKSPPQLTAALIVRNCASQLRATLDSVNELADEIVVLDTGSTDDTPRIAQEFGARAFRRPWDDDFSAARNACLAHARGQWVLWLDAGETLPADSASALRGRLDQPLDHARAWLLPVVLPLAPGQLAGEQMNQVRLHPRLDGLQFAGRVRESLDESLRLAGLAMDFLDIPIRRPAADLDTASRAHRARRNIRLSDLAIAEHGPSAAMHNCLGEAWQRLGDSLQAAQHYTRALQLATSGSREALEALYGQLTCLDTAGADRQAQLGLAMNALGLFPLDAHLLVAAGGYLYDLQQPQLAIRAFDLAFRHGQVERRLWHVADIQEIAARSAARLLLGSGRADQACTLLTAAVRLWPGSRPLAGQLSAALSASRQNHGKPAELVGDSDESSNVASSQPSQSLPLARQEANSSSATAFA